MPFPSPVNGKQKCDEREVGSRVLRHRRHGARIKPFAAGECDLRQPALARTPSPSSEGGDAVREGEGKANTAAGLAGHYIRKRLRTAGWARQIAVFSGLLLIAGILVYRLGGVDFTALEAVLRLVGALVFLALLLALSGLAKVWRSGHEGGGKAAGALFVGLIVAMPFVGAALLAYESPRVSHAETDGMLAVDIADGASLAEALPAATGSPVLDGRQFQARAAQVYVLVRTVLADEGWTLVDVATADPEEEPAPENGDLGTSGTVDIPLPQPRDPAALAKADPFARPESREYTIRALATGPILALPSDVVIRIAEDDDQTYVDLRSTSTMVEWDLGQNRRFVEAFLAALDTAMASLVAIGPVGEG